MKTLNSEDHTCPSCENNYRGKYCNLCGEKTLEERDFKLSKILANGLGAFTNLDSKFFKSIHYLFLKPGVMSLKNIEGIRVPFIKPFQFFVIANVLFFLYLNDLDVFRTPSVWYFKEDFDGIRVLSKVREIMSELGKTQEQIAMLYDARSSNIAKGFIFLQLPFVAGVFMLLNIRKKMAYGKHFILGTHYFTFVLFFCVLWSFLGENIFQFDNKLLYIIPITLAMVVYAILSIHNFYRDTWTVSIFKGALAVLLVNIVIQFYRVSVNLVSLNSL